MAEQEFKSSKEAEEYSSGKARKMPIDTDNGEVAEGEIGNDEEECSEEGPAAGQSSRIRPEGSPVVSKDSDSRDGGEGRRHRPSSDRRRHHHRHHSSSHREHRRRRSGGHSDADGEVLGAEEDSRGRRRSDSAGDSYSDQGVADKGGHGHSRKHERSSRRSSQPHSQQQRSRHIEDSADNSEWSDSYEDPLAGRDSAYSSKRHSREKRDSYQAHLGALSERGEAEDGEILEDGELDDDEEEIEGVKEEEYRNEAEASDSPSKPYSKEEKHDRKKDHKERRKRDSDEKRKRKKFAEAEHSDEESSPAPAWGSGYQGHKPKTSPYHNKQPRYGRGSKGYQSPPGLYDSPSYSEESEEEGIAKGLLTEGYIDASVAADEKEGIFNSRTSLGKKKKRERLYEKVDRKRGRFMDGKLDGPPKKKALVDLAMSERPVCKFYMEGKCAKGSGCQFNHDVEKPKKMEVCKYHLTVKGCHKERCPYMHQDFPCKYYHTGAKCYSGERCKFSHDPLTEDTRRALEMRVAAEDIVDMEDPEYNYEYRSNREFEPRPRPSLLGSPPRYRPEMKKIPSLFEIEVRPPGQSPKPSPQAVRPSGFYSETNASPKPGMGPPSSTGGPMNSPNMGMMNNSGPMNQNNQQGFNNNQGNMGGGPGLLQPPVRPGGIMGAGPMGNRPNMMVNQQGMNPQQQRPGGGPPVQFMGPNQQQQQQQQGGNLPPVLNMLGAIIREAAMHKGPGGGPNNNMNMGPGNMGPRPNMGPNMNNMGPNNIRPGNMGPNNMQVGGGMGGMGPNNMGGPPNSMGNMMTPNNMGNMAPNSMGNMPPNTMNNMGPANMGQNIMNHNTMNMGPNSGQGTMGPNNMNMNNMGPNTNMGNMGPQNLNMGPNSNMGPGAEINNMGPKSGMNNNIGPNMMGNNRNVGQPNMGQEVGIMDVDYRIKRDYEEMEEASQDLSELDKLRRQLKEQIDKEDEEAGDEEEEDGTVEMKDDGKMQNKEQSSPERSENSLDKDDLKDSKGGMLAEAGLDSIEIPAHLPKKQRELFKRIQQQQILREKERERQEAMKAAEEAKADADDWYSSDEEDGDGQAKPKLTDVLKKLNQESLASAATKENQPSVASLATAAFGTSSSASTATPPTASTFNIMQMINAIKSQTPVSSTTAATKAAGASPPSTLLNPLTDSPASPPPPSPTNKIPNFILPTLTVDPPVVSAKPLKPLVYNIVKIALPTARPYMQLPNEVNASDPVFKLDPRVKWHLQYLEKQMQKEQQRRSSAEGDKSPKAADPRLKKGSGDPRLAKGGDSPGSGKSEGSKPTDPRLQRLQAQSRPVDPRLARQAAGNMDPRINRQNSQNSQDGNNFMSGPVNNVMGNQMGGLGGNQMGGPMGSNQMGGPMNAMGGPSNMGPMGNQMGGPMGNQMGGPMGNQMVGPMTMGNQMGGNIGPMGNQMGGAMNSMGGRPMGPVGNNMNMMGGGPMNQMSGPMGHMGPRPNQMNRMGGPQGMGNMGGPGPNMMGGSMGPRGLMGQQNPLGNDLGVFDPRMNNNPVDPRLGGPRPPNDPRSAADPRFRSKAADPREQKFNPKDPRSSTTRDPRAISVSSPNEDFSGDTRNYGGNSDSGSFQSSRLQDDFRQSPNSYGQNDTNSFSNQGGYKMSQKQEEWMQDTDLRLENEGFSPSSSSSSAPLAMQEADSSSKPAPKFDHRNDPRFKRVKRFTGQRKSSLDYSSPLGGEDGQGASDDGGDSGYNNYNRPKVNNRDPRARNSAPSPTLPDTLQDFDTPDMTPPPVSEPDLKVKDLFKTIDPTASPFC